MKFLFVTVVLSVDWPPPSAHLTSYIAIRSKLHFASLLATVYSEPAYTDSQHTMLLSTYLFCIAYVIPKNPSNSEGLCNIS